MATCNHEHTTIESEAVYAGPVATAEDHVNRAAHGNVTRTVTCDACGARRRENANQGHREYGAWGPSREQRRQVAERARAELIAARDRVTTREAVLNGPRGERVTVAICDDGFLSVVAESGAEPSGETIAAAWPNGVAAAAEIRRLSMRAEILAHEVA